MANPNPRHENLTRKGRNFGNKGGGRKPDEFKALCAKIASSPEAMKFLEDMVKGEPIQEKIIDTPGHEAQMLLVSASPDARIKAWKELKEHAYGKSLQPVDNDPNNNLRDVLERIAERYK